jgi:hypothetical protein
MGSLTALVVVGHPSNPKGAWPTRLRVATNSRAQVTTSTNKEQACPTSAVPAILVSTKWGHPGIAPTWSVRPKFPQHGLTASQRGLSSPPNYQRPHVVEEVSIAHSLPIEKTPPHRLVLAGMKLQRMGHNLNLRRNLAPADAFVLRHDKETITKCFDLVAFFLAGRAWPTSWPKTSN